ncbi:unnamed protein product, partial [Brassica rapa subsp. narinosa]
MPQLDKFTYFSQFFWLCLFFFTFYIFICNDGDGVLGISRILKLRNQLLSHRGKTIQSKDPNSLEDLLRKGFSTEYILLFSAFQLRQQFILSYSLSCFAFKLSVGLSSLMIFHFGPGPTGGHLPQRKLHSSPPPENGLYLNLDVESSDSLRARNLQLGEDLERIHEMERNLQNERDPDRRREGAERIDREVRELERKISLCQTRDAVRD